MTPRLLKKRPAPGPLALAVRRILFYSWAYGEIGEPDSEIGILGEYIIGKALDCLPRKRSVNGRYDLTLKDGRTLEVKTTCRPRTDASHAGSWTWNILDQKKALEGHGPVADWWAFIKVEIPEEERRKPRFNPFDDRWYTIYLLKGETLQSLGQTRQISESTLQKAQARRCTIPDLPTHFQTW